MKLDWNGKHFVSWQHIGLKASPRRGPNLKALKIQQRHKSQCASGWGVLLIKSIWLVQRKAPNEPNKYKYHLNTLKTKSNLLCCHFTNGLFWPGFPATNQLEAANDLLQTCCMWWIPPGHRLSFSVAFSHDAQLLHYLKWENTKTNKRTACGAPHPSKTARLVPSFGRVFLLFHKKGRPIRSNGTQWNLFLTRN